MPGEQHLGHEIAAVLPNTLRAEGGHRNALLTCSERVVTDGRATAPSILQGANLRSQHGGCRRGWGSHCSWRTPREQ